MTRDDAQELLDTHGNASAAARDLSRTLGGSVSTWRRRLGQALASQPTVEEVGTFKDMLTEQGFDPEAVVIQGGRISFSQQGSKLKRADGTHEVVVTPLKHSQLVFKPVKTKADFEWPVIHPADPVIIDYCPAPPVAAGGPQRVLIVPDCQITFLRDLRTGELHAAHDVKAMDALLQVAAVYRPRRVVILGDLDDASTLSRYLQVPEFQLTLQPALDYTYRWLKKLRAVVGPDCEIDFIFGNHERRFAEYIAKNAAAAAGIRVADTTGWPAWSLPVLLRFDELGIRASAEFPGGKVWLTPELVCVHQDPKMANLRASVIHGHTPHTRVTSRTFQYYDESKTYRVFSVGGLMRTSNTDIPDGLCQTAVPSDSTDGDWDQSFAVVDIYDDSHFDVQFVYLDGQGRCAFRGEEFQGLEAA